MAVRGEGICCHCCQFNTVIEVESQSAPCSKPLYLYEFVRVCARARACVRVCVCACVCMWLCVCAQEGGTQCARQSVIILKVRRGRGVGDQQTSTSQDFISLP